jgi:hypothetical protein
MYASLFGNLRGGPIEASSKLHTLVREGEVGLTVAIFLNQQTIRPGSKTESIQTERYLPSLSLSTQ